MGANPFKATVGLFGFDFKPYTRLAASKQDGIIKFVDGGYNIMAAAAVETAASPFAHGEPVDDNISYVTPHTEVEDNTTLNKDGEPAQDEVVAEVQAPLSTSINSKSVNDRADATASPAALPAKVKTTASISAKNEIGISRTAVTSRNKIETLRANSKPVNNENNPATSRTQLGTTTPTPAKDEFDLEEYYCLGENAYGRNMIVTRSKPLFHYTADIKFRHVHISSFGPKMNLKRPLTAYEKSQRNMKWQDRVKAEKERLSVSCKMLKMTYQEKAISTAVFTRNRRRAKLYRVSARIIAAENAKAADAILSAASDESSASLLKNVGMKATNSTNPETLSDLDKNASHTANLQSPTPPASPDSKLASPVAVSTTTAESLQSWTYYYQSTGIQTLPPLGFASFQKVYGRAPAQNEIGCAGIGRFMPGQPDPYKHRYGQLQSKKMMQPKDIAPAGCKVSGFQTMDFKKCDEALEDARDAAEDNAEKLNIALADHGCRIILQKKTLIAHSAILPSTVRVGADGAVYFEGNEGNNGRVLPNLIVELIPLLTKGDPIPTFISEEFEKEIAFCNEYGNPKKIYSQDSCYVPSVFNLQARTMSSRREIPLPPKPSKIPSEVPKMATQFSSSPSLATKFIRSSPSGSPAISTRASSAEDHAPNSKKRKSATQIDSEPQNYLCKDKTERSSIVLEQHVARDTVIEHTACKDIGHNTTIDAKVPVSIEITAKDNKIPSPPLSRYCMNYQSNEEVEFQTTRPTVEATPTPAPEQQKSSAYAEKSREVIFTKLSSTNEVSATKAQQKLAASSTSKTPASSDFVIKSSGLLYGPNNPRFPRKTPSVIATTTVRNDTPQVEQNNATLGGTKSMTTAITTKREIKTSVAEVARPVTKLKAKNEPEDDRRAPKMDCSNTAPEAKIPKTLRTMTLRKSRSPTLDLIKDIIHKSHNKIKCDRLEGLKNDYSRHAYPLTRMRYTPTSAATNQIVAPVSRTARLIDKHNIEDKFNIKRESKSSTQEAAKPITKRKSEDEHKSELGDGHPAPKVTKRKATDELENDRRAPKIARSSDPRPKRHPRGFSLAAIVQQTVAANRPGMGSPTAHTYKKAPEDVKNRRRGYAPDWNAFA